MSEPCPVCDFIGPFTNAEAASVRDLHRAFHDVWRALTIAFAPLVVAVCGQAKRERQATKDAYVLMNESVAASLRGER